MISPAIRYYLLSAVIIFIEVLVFFFVLQTPFQPIDGTSFFASGQQCHKPATLPKTEHCEFNDVSLPVLARDRAAATPIHLRLEFVWNRPEPLEHMTAIYLPKIAEAIQVRVNGTLLLDMVEDPSVLVRNWNRPVLINVPANNISRTNLIEISVFGYPQDGAVLHPFHIGPRSILEPNFDRRWLVTKVAAQIGMAFMLLSAVLFGSLYLTGHKRETYGWLTAASICAAVFNGHYLLSTIPFSYWTWTIIWNVAIHLLVCSLYKFILRYAGLPVSKFERWYWIVLVIAGVVLVLAPKEYIFEFVAGLGILSVVVGGGGLVSLCIGRKNLGMIPFVTLYGLFSIALAIAAHDWIFMFVRPAPNHMHVGQFALPMITTISVWLIMSDLMRSAAENGELNRELQTTVDVTTERLTKSYEQLAKVEKRQILETERQRIMFDLHDGVGGQLVNTLAYMQTDGHADPTVRASIENMLRDLGLMIDSLEAHDNLTTSLGMLRSRLEPLLERTGMTFNWQVTDEPVTPGTGPTLSLNVLRIAQEAITNSVKHANATEISVETDASSITIRDNGVGIASNVGAKRSGRNSGLGIVGMKKRAHDIGAEISFSSSTSGTTVLLKWKQG